MPKLYEPGHIYISFNDQSHILKGEFTYSCRDMVRETIMGQDGVHGYSERVCTPYINGAFRDTGNLEVKDFNAMKNVTLTLELENEKTVVWREMGIVKAEERRTSEWFLWARWEGLSDSINDTE